MEYPIWQLTTLAGGFWIAFIATVHVYVAHFAVGGGLFLVLAEIKAAREQSPILLDYVKRHVKFFLLLTMVFGGVTGVGIWVTISLLSPQATSSLIHIFVFGWAAEWVCFLGEIVALLVYYYAFDRLERRDHVRVGWLYFVFAWLSLFLINGIIGFMLTPGQWLATRDFWDGFFNPSFWPSLFFRTFLSLMIAGLFGFLTATRIKDESARIRMVRSCAVWTAAPFALFLLCGLWYFKAMPAGIQDLIWAKSERIGSFLTVFFWTGPLAVLGGLLMAARIPDRVRTPLAFVLLALGLGLIGSFEFIREAGRKPWLIPGQLYSNSILKDQVALINGQGLLKTARWARLREVTDANRLEAGAEVFRIECSSCHSIDGPMNDILPRTAKFTAFGMDSLLDGMGTFGAYMPPFAGTLAERRALAAFIVEGLHDRKDAGDAAVSPQAQGLRIPPFDAARDGYVLLAWSATGMQLVSDADALLSLSPPGNDVRAVLIRRGDPPARVQENVELAYRIEQGFENPSRQTDFWKSAPALFGLSLPENLGLAGFGPAGGMKQTEDLFDAVGLPALPYPDAGGFMPYPLLAVEARDASSRQVLARTALVVPASTELGCRRCHGGTWRKAGLAGLSDETARDVLATHDRMSGTRLLAEALSGRPAPCFRCHADAKLKAEGRPGLLGLSASMHGLHANYLTNRGPEACAACHPARPDGPTRCQRDTHAKVGIGCVRCHGFLEDHALSLLRFEQEAGKKGASRLMANLKPRGVKLASEINPRAAWTQGPDCLTCHKDFQRPDPATSSAFNAWTKPGETFHSRRDDMGAIPCAGCHGSAHATYPANNPYGADRDNIQPMQYMGMAKTMGANGQCIVCHVKPMDADAHHPNTVKPRQ